MSEEFRYDPDTHTYWLGARRLLGVSEVINGAGLKDFSGIPAETLEHARLRGIAVHDACHFLDENDLDWSSVSGEIEPYVKAWERFKKDTGAVVESCEVASYHPTLFYAGRLDRIVRFPMARTAMLLDLKTYKPDAVTGVQLAAYANLQGLPVIRAGLWLKDTGKYSLTEFNDENGDWSVFLMALKLAQFKEAKR